MSRWIWIYGYVLTSFPHLLAHSHGYNGYDRINNRVVFWILLSDAFLRSANHISKDDAAAYSMLV